MQIDSGSISPWLDFFQQGAHNTGDDCGFARIDCNSDGQWKYVVTNMKWSINQAPAALIFKHYLAKRSQFQNLLVWTCAVALWAISELYYHWNSNAQSLLVLLVLVGIAYNAYHLIVSPRRRTLFNVFYVYWFMTFGLAFFIDTFAQVPDMAAAIVFFLMMAAVVCGKMWLDNEEY